RDRAQPPLWERGCATVEDTLIKIDIDAPRQRAVGCSDWLDVIRWKQTCDAERTWGKLAATATMCEQSDYDEHYDYPKPAETTRVAREKQSRDSQVASM